MEKMKLGVLVVLGGDMDAEIRKVHDLGFATCQVCGWNDAFFTDEVADAIRTACAAYGVTITAFWCGWGQNTPSVWDFYDGPLTLGLVPVAYRAVRLAFYKKGSDFAKKLGVTDFATHVGFIPEDPNTHEYHELVSTLRHLAQYLKRNDQNLLFETGQETPVAMLRCIQDIGLDNLYVNLDPANLILYGKANPVDALRTLGKYVRGVHAKDGDYPTDGRNLGLEQPIGAGCVNFPALVEGLRKVGYAGALTIEREIEGDRQIADIRSAKTLLESLIG